MARYIDADELLKELQEELDFETPMYTEEQNKYFNSGLRCAIRDVKKAPTADVVPKSEVERLENEVKILTENSISTKYPNCVLCSRGVILTKSLEDYDKLIGDISSSTKIEVAREIFEGIDKIIIDSSHLPKCCRFIDIDELEELKKKFVPDTNVGHKTESEDI